MSNNNNNAAVHSPPGSDVRGPPCRRSSKPVSIEGTAGYYWPSYPSKSNLQHCEAGQLGEIRIGTEMRAGGLAERAQSRDSLSKKVGSTYTLPRGHHSAEIR